MSPRTLLIVTFHFPPSAASGSFRLLGFTRHLPKYGWRSAVVAPPTIPWEPVDQALTGQLPPDTAVYPVPYRKGLLQRFAKYSVWLPRALAACRTAVRAERPEAVLTSGPPHQVHLLGLALKRLHGLPWVADFRDPWATGDRNGSLRARGTASLERAVIRAADAVVANARGAAAVLRTAYPDEERKIFTITNGYDREKFSGPLPPRDPSAPATIVHAGAIYVGRDPRPFLDAVAGFVPHGGKPLRVRFLGPPPEDGTDLGAEVRKRGLEEVVTLAGQVPYARSLEEMTRADVLLLLDSPGRQVGVPAKLYEYIGAGRPVLALGERAGDLAWVLGESGIPHRLAALNDPAAIGRALSELVALPPAPRVESPRFTREALAGRLAEVLEDCAGLKPGARRAATPAVCVGQET